LLKHFEGLEVDLLLCFWTHSISPVMHTVAKNQNTQDVPQSGGVEYSMVRIRSDRWYSGENQKETRRIAPSNSNGTRRLISLFFLLALVLVLMAKVSDPKNMRQIFEALGIPLEQQVIATTHPQPEAAGENQPGSGNSAVASMAEQSAGTHLDTPWHKTCADLIPQLLNKASPQQIDQLAEYWFSTAPTPVAAGKASPPLTIESTSLIQQLKEKLDPSSTAHQLWSDLLTQFDARWQAVMVDVKHFHQGEASEISISPQARTPIDEFHDCLSGELDRILLANLRDGSPWNSTETVAFGRLLQRGKNFQFGSVDPPLVATKQLDGDFLKLRGSWVRFRATVRLIESIDREQPLVGQSSYSVLWLRGFDGSTQPIAVYTTSFLVNQLKGSVSPQNFPEIEIIGLVGKKLAYASAAGVEVTPTLFAGSIVQFAPDLAEQLSPKENSISRQIGIAGLAALVFSLIAVVFVWKRLRTKNSTRHRRGSLNFSIGLIAASLLGSSTGWSQDPPWKSSPLADEVKVQVVQQRLQSAFDEQQIQQIQQFIDGNETSIPDAILRAMFALNQVGWDSTWQTGRAIELADDYELKPVKLAGWAWAVQVLTLASPQQQWFSAQPVKSIYRIQIQPAAAKDQQPPELVSVFCRDVPKLWRESAQLKQPIQLNCYSFTRSPGENTPTSKPQFYFAERVSWIMSDADVLQAADVHPTVPADWLTLAKLGWDLAWFDILAANNQKRLSIAETGPLLKLLEITLSTADKASSPMTTVQPIDSMKKPLEHLVAPIDWQVRLVSGSIVELATDSAKVKYYQLDGFVKIPNQTVNYTIPDTGQSITFENEFPVTIVTRSDQEFVPLDKLSAGDQTWQIGKTARVQGRFLRLWSYHSQRLSTRDASNRQVAPLVVASQLTEVNALPEVSQKSLWSVVLLGCAMLSVMFWVLRNFAKKSTRPLRR
jgi:hypothetical protein